MIKSSKSDGGVNRGIKSAGAVKGIDETWNRIILEVADRKTLGIPPLMVAVYHQSPIGWIWPLWPVGHTLLICSKASIMWIYYWTRGAIWCLSMEVLVYTKDRYPESFMSVPVLEADRPMWLFLYRTNKQKQWCRDHIHYQQTLRACNQFLQPLLKMLKGYSLNI